MDSTNEKETAGSPRMLIRRRRVPRRDYTHRIGLLIAGQYHITRAMQIGEGGMMFYSAVKMRIGQRLVLTFKLPGQNPEVVMGCVRYILQPDQTGQERYGIEFLNLDFNVKREVRNYVAQNGTYSQSEIDLTPPVHGRA